jgi:uncharacterized protein (TIGR03083 family)
MDGDAGAHYRVSRLRLSELLRDQPSDAWALPVPACPGWNVQGAVSHVLGNIEDAMAGRITGPPTEEQVAEQVARHADDAPGSLLDEWTDAAATFEDLVSLAAAWLAVVDLVTHEQDVRGALGLPGAREEESMRLAARMLASAELPVTLAFDRRWSSSAVHTVLVRILVARATRIRTKKRGQAAARLARTCGTTSAAKRSIDGVSAAGCSPGAEPQVTTSVRP